MILKYIYKCKQFLVTLHKLVFNKLKKMLLFFFIISILCILYLIFYPNKIQCICIVIIIFQIILILQIILVSNFLMQLVNFINKFLIGIVYGIFIFIISTKIQCTHLTLILYYL